MEKHISKEGPQQVFWDLGFGLFEGQDPGT